MALASLLAQAQDMTDVTISFAPGKSVFFTCLPGGQVIGLAYQLPVGKMSKAQMAQDFQDILVSCPQVVQDKVNAALAAAQTAIGAV